MACGGGARRPEALRARGLELAGQLSRVRADSGGRAGADLVAGFGGPKGNLCIVVPDPWTTGEPPSDSTRARHLKLSSILFYVGTLRPRAEV